MAGKMGRVSVKLAAVLAVLLLGGCACDPWSESCDSLPWGLFHRPRTGTERQEMTRFRSAVDRYSEAASANPGVACVQAAEYEKVKAEGAAAAGSKDWAKVAAAAEHVENLIKRLHEPWPGGQCVQASR